MNQQHWVTLIQSEVASARAKFPDPKLALTALVEEVGEAVKAALDHYHGKGSLDDIRKELVQVGAMVVRLLEEGDPSHNLPATLSPLVTHPEIPKEGKPQEEPIPMPSVEEWWNMVLRHKDMKDTAFLFQAHYDGVLDTIAWLRTNYVPTKAPSRQEIERAYLRELILEIEDKDFRTEHDTGAHDTAQRVHYVLRKRYGLPFLSIEDLPRSTGRDYIMPEGSNLLREMEKRGGQVGTPPNVIPVQPTPLPEFNLEPRYLVFKRKDVRDLPAQDQVTLERIAMTLHQRRGDEGRVALECLVIEKDWPEYNPALLMLTRRVLMERMHGPSV